MHGHLNVRLDSTCLASTLAKDSAYFSVPTIDFFLFPVSLHIPANNHGIQFLSFLPQHSIQNLLPQIQFIPSIIPPSCSCMCHYTFHLPFQATYLCLTVFVFFRGSRINLHVPVAKSNISNQHIVHYILSVALSKFPLYRAPCSTHTRAHARTHSEH